MNIVCLLGSPRRKSNSSAIAMRFVDTARELGADVTTYRLNDLEYRGCQACMGCKRKSEKCVLRDDLAEVLQAFADSDVVVMASPIYYGDVSSQLKAFIDRLYSFLKPDYVTNPDPVRIAPGKKLVFALTQGEPEGSYDDVFDNYDTFMKWYGFDESHLLRACAVRDIGDIDARQDVLAAAEEVARKLCSA